MPYWLMVAKKVTEKKQLLTKHNCVFQKIQLTLFYYTFFDYNTNLSFGWDNNPEMNLINFSNFNFSFRISLSRRLKCSFEEDDLYWSDNTLYFLFSVSTFVLIGNYLDIEYHEIKPSNILLDVKICLQCMIHFRWEINIPNRIIKLQVTFYRGTFPEQKMLVLHRIHKILLFHRPFEIILVLFAVKWKQ